jgi:hypothetical protein
MTDELRRRKVTKAGDSTCPQNVREIVCMGDRT